MTERLTELELDQQRRYEQGDPILVEAYLADHPDLGADTHAVVRLLVQEFRLRRQHGEAPTVEEYCQRFPEHEDLLKGLILAELPTPRLDSQDETVTAFPRLEGYRIVGELGRGGMGTVYRAWHERLHCWVALKTLNGLAGGDRLLLEAEAIARLRHPNIVCIHDVGEWRCQVGVVPFLVLELAEGGSLGRQLGGKPQAPAEAAALVETLARAMQHAHDGGIVHRDLKPANVLLATQGTPKITDFGLAKDLHSHRGLTASGDILGTPSYMAPEQVRGQGGTVGPPCDIYALGAILYELLTGRPPFQAATHVETVLLVLEEEPVAPRRLQPKLSRDLETICLKCLEKNPLRRYPTASALADDLRRFQEHRPVLARPVSLVRRVAKWARRNPALAASLFLVLGSASALGTQWYRFTVDLKHQRDQAEHNAEEAKRQTGLAVANLRRARQTAERFYLTVRDHKELQELPTEKVRLELLRQALALQEQLIEDYPELPELLAEQARSYHMLGTLVVDLASPRESLPYLRKAVAIAEQFVAADPDDRSRQADLAIYESSLALRLGDIGEVEEAERLARRAVERGEKVVAEETDSEVTIHRYNHASAKLNLGLLLRRTNRLKEAEAFYISARADAQAVHAISPRAPDHLNLLGMICNNLAVLFQRSNRFDLAADAYEEAIRVRTTLVEGNSGKPGYFQGLAVTWVNAAGLYRQQQRYQAADHAYVRAVAVQSRLVEKHPTPRVYRTDLARIHERAGAYYRSRGRMSEASESCRLAVALRRALADEVLADAGTARELAASLLAWVAVAPPTEEGVTQLLEVTDRLRRWSDRPDVAKTLAEVNRARSHLKDRLERRVESPRGHRK